MAATQVQICNLALGHVSGKGVISSLTEQTREAIQCNRVYDLCRQMVLRAHAWQFAKTCATLNNLGSPPTNWSYRYAYPTDCLRALAIVDPLESGTPIPFEVISGETVSTRVIITDQADAELEYTRDMSDPVVYPLDFVAALSWLIAAHIALPLSGDANLQAGAWQAYRAALQHAGANDANEGHHKRPTDVTPSWISARA